MTLQRPLRVQVREATDANFTAVIFKTCHNHTEFSNYHPNNTLHQQKDLLTEGSNAEQHFLAIKYF